MVQNTFLFLCGHGNFVECSIDGIHREWIGWVHRLRIMKTLHVPKSAVPELALQRLQYSGLHSHTKTPFRA